MSQVLTRDIFCNAPVGSITISVDSACENPQGYIEYKVSVLVDNYSFDIGRRFSQFKDFDKILRQHFRDITLPGLPSKFSLMHKIEQRKKGFHAYMSGLLQLLAVINIDQRAIFLRLLAEFLQLDGSRLSMDDDRYKKSSNKIGVAEVIQKGNAVGTFRGWVEVKLVEEWVNYYANIQGDCIYLFENMDVSSFTYAISLFLGRVQTRPAGLLELHHDHENRPICFRSPMSEDFKKALIIACSSNTDSPLSQFKKNCAGRISVTIHSGNYLCVPKPATSMVKPHIFVSIDLDCFNFTTRVVPQENGIVWEQTFVM